MAIHSSANVHASVTIEGDVSIGPRCQVGAGVVLRGPLIIGDETRVYPNCVIGLEGEHRTKGPVGVIRIGNGTVLRELSVIHRGTGERETTIGDGCYLMTHTYVAHDCMVEDDVTSAANAAFAGHTRILRGANIGMGAVVHQFSTIGAYAMVGMGSVVTRDVPPFCLVAGNPARYARINTHALRVNGWREDAVRTVDGDLVFDLPELAAHHARFIEQSRRKRVLTHS